MKKLLAFMLAFCMVLGFAGLGARAAETDDQEAEISLWTYPIGKWGDQETLDGFVAKFNEKYPNIKVDIQLIDYKTGDDQVTTAIEANSTPDIIMEGPERLVSNWGAKGKMVDLADLWTDEVKADIQAVSPMIEKACVWSDGKYYEYPLCMTTHTMAINKEAFEAAGAMQYIDEATRTWTTADFEKALQALKDKGEVPNNLIVYCGGQGGDQGTRALVTNLYGAKFANEDHTEWTIDSEAGKKGLQQLVDWAEAGLVTPDAGIVASDELTLFANGSAAMTICWNASNAMNYAEQVQFTPYPVAFPSEDGTPELAGGIWGFGIFDNGDANRVEAAKKFIDFVANDEAQAVESVRVTGFFPVRESLGNVYAGTEDEERMMVFGSFMKYLGDYYNVTPGWAEQRTAWWNMLQQIFSGTPVDEALATYKNAAKPAA